MPTKRHLVEEKEAIESALNVIERHCACSNDFSERHPDSYGYIRLNRDDFVRTLR